MKTTGALALSTFLALACAACSPTDAPAPANANAALPAPDSNFRHEAAGIQFDVPSGWRTHNDGDRMSIAAPDGAMTIIVFTAGHESMAAVADEVDRQIGKVVKHARPEGDLEQGERNGIAVLSQRGTGEVDGSPIEWSARLFEAKQHVLVLSFGKPGSYDKHYADVERFLASFRPA